MTGMTAGSKDFNDSMKSHLPIVFGFVLGLAFLLLLVTFRSIVIPVKAIVLNLLSVGAAYGVLKLVFQDGHGESLLGFESIGGITAWLPLFLFVILFGLSMDYHVFIISRIREAVDRGMKTDEAVAHGIKQTAGVVTSAAVVMVAVFSIFGSLSMIEFKQMGVGLAVAVLIDATIVRGVLLPAAMKLLGEWNWYLPKRLDWLPKISHEPTTLPEPSQRVGDRRPARREAGRGGVALTFRACASASSPEAETAPDSTRSSAASSARASTTSATSSSASATGGRGCSRTRPSSSPTPTRGASCTAAARSSAPRAPTRSRSRAGSTRCARRCASAGSTR